LIKHGTNTLSEKKSTPGWILFLKELTSLFPLLMWAGMIISFVGYGLQENRTDQSNLILGAALGIATLLSGIFAHFQNSKAASMMA